MQGEMQSKALMRAIRRVTDYIAAQTKPVTGKQIADNVNSRTKDVYEALSWLRSNGRIEANGDGVKGDPILYRLATKRFPLAQQATPAKDEPNIKQPEFEEFVV